MEFILAPQVGLIRLTTVPELQLTCHPAGKTESTKSITKTAHGVCTSLVLWSKRYFFNTCGRDEERPANPNLIDGVRADFHPSKWLMGRHRHYMISLIQTYGPLKPALSRARADYYCSFHMCMAHITAGCTDGVRHQSKCCGSAHADITSLHRDYLTSLHRDYLTSLHRDYLTSLHRDYLTSLHRDQVTSQHSLVTSQYGLPTAKIFNLLRRLPHLSACSLAELIKTCCSLCDWCSTKFDLKVMLVPDHITSL
uniref:Uncharacterized protein n=1 Tax=Timema monikensis TaxID=170555 RepID=A0A7R9EGS8_9NEOP|nr:unnamed protein product [Timema monikensis]